MSDMVKKIASFFDDPVEAEKMINEKLMGITILSIRRDDTTAVTLEEFYQCHKLAYEKRVKHNTPHRLEILRLDLVGEIGGCANPTGGPQPPNLDDLERRRTEPEYVYRPGKRKSW